MKCMYVLYTKQDYCLDLYQSGFESSSAQSHTLLLVGGHHISQVSPGQLQHQSNGVESHSQQSQDVGMVELVHHACLCAAIVVDVPALCLLLQLGDVAFYRGVCFADPQLLHCNLYLLKNDIELHV